MNHFDLDRLLAQEEGQHFERKSLWDRSGSLKRVRNPRVVRDQIAEYVAAFANADGGVLVLGVEDDGTFTGHGYPNEAVEVFLNVPQYWLSIPLPRGQRVHYEGLELLLFDVAPEPVAVGVAGNGFPRRSGDRVVRDSEEGINAIKNRNRLPGKKPS